MAKSDDLTQIKELLEVVKHKVERQEIFLDAHDLKVPHFAE